MTALLSEMSIICIRAGCEVRMARYAFKHSSQSLSNGYFCVYSVFRHITWKLQVIRTCLAYRTTAVLSETLFVWLRFAIEIWLESYGPRHASVILWYSIVCVYCKPVYTSLFGAQLRLTTELTYLMTAYYTPNDSFTANDTLFYKNKFG